MNRTDLKKLTRMRLKEAKALYKQRHYSGAYYLAGYAVECALKACIAKETRRYDFPDKGKVQKSYTHELKTLLGITGLDGTFDLAIRSNSKLDLNWTFVRNWSEESRYEFRSQADAHAIIEAISNSTNGVLPWIMQHW